MTHPLHTLNSFFIVHRGHTQVGGRAGFPHPTAPAGGLAGAGRQLLFLPGQLTCGLRGWAHWSPPAVSPPAEAASGPVRQPAPTVGEDTGRYARHLAATGLPRAERGPPQVLPTRAPSRFGNHDAEMSFPSRRQKKQMTRRQAGFRHALLQPPPSSRFSSAVDYV